MKICFFVLKFFLYFRTFQKFLPDKILLFSKFKLLIASKILKVPRPFTSAEYSGTSKETFTCDWAAKLYISFGLTFLSNLILMKHQLSHHTKEQNLIYN